MSAADQLRTAAERLRALAEAATPGPWSASHDKPSPHRPPDTYDVVGGPDGYGPGFSGLFGDAAFIATMDPTTALLVADWLSKYAELLPDEEDVRLWNRPAFDDLPAALALAEYVNGRTSK